jgi:hypothetical protein
MASQRVMRRLNQVEPNRARQVTSEGVTAVLVAARSGFGLGAAQPLGDLKILGIMVPGAGKRQNKGRR